MVDKETINQDFWKVIELHYAKECYTDALKDACLYLIELIQDKSEVDNLDGEALINNVFSEKNPKLLINNNQTETEKDEQRGFYYMLRGIICAVRNPISHKNSVKFSKQQADSVLIFINNYILPKLDDSKDFGYVDDWYDFIFVSNDNDSHKYSDAILENIPKKEKYNLMIKIVNNLESIPARKYKYIINKLFSSLNAKEQSDIIVLLNKKLIRVGDGKYLKMFFDHFDIKIWNKLDSLVKVRIEEMIYKAIENGRAFESPFSMKIEYSDKLGPWAIDWINEFDNHDDIIDLLYNKMGYKFESDYISRYYFELMISKEIFINHIPDIIKGLELGNPHFKKLIDYRNTFSKKELLNNDLKTAYDNFEESDDYEELPF